MRRLIIFVVLILIFSSTIAWGQELVPDTQVTLKAKVLKIISEETRNIPGTDTPTIFQKLKVEIIEGEDKGKEVEVENDYLNLEVGEKFLLVHTYNPLDGKTFYSVSEPYRLPMLGLLAIIFILSVIIFGGMQGLRGLVSLALSLFFIIYLLLPGVIAGYPPLFIAVAVSALIIIVGSYITHGFNRTTTAAVFGMLATIVFTGVLAYLAVKFTRLSGYHTDEVVYLNFNFRGSIDLVGLLLGGIMIGLLGVLYDAAISQAVIVEELHHVAPHLPRKYIYKRALRIGREHIGALVDTLAIAYVGVSLPLLLLFYSADASLGEIINREIFATEIVRTLVGSIGLILTVPITTFISVLILIKPKVGGDNSIIEKEAQEFAHFEHKH